MPRLPLEDLCVRRLGLTSNISYRSIEIFFVKIATAITKMCLLLLPKESMNWIVGMQGGGAVFVNEVGSIVGLKEGIGSCFENGVISSSGVEGVMCSVDARHWSNFIDARVSPLDILVNLSFVVFDIESFVIVKLDGDESFANIFSGLAPKLLQKRQLQHLISCESFGRIKFEEF